MASVIIDPSLFPYESYLVNFFSCWKASLAFVENRFCAIWLRYMLVLLRIVYMKFGFCICLSIYALALDIALAFVFIFLFFLLPFFSVYLAASYIFLVSVSGLSV